MEKELVTSSSVYRREGELVCQTRGPCSIGLVVCTVPERTGVEKGRQPTYLHRRVGALNV